MVPSEIVRWWLRTAEPPNRRIAEAPDRRVAETPDRRIAETLDLRITGHLSRRTYEAPKVVRRAPEVVRSIVDVGSEKGLRRLVATRRYWDAYGGTGRNVGASGGMRTGGTGCLQAVGCAEQACKGGVPLTTTIKSPPFYLIFWSEGQISNRLPACTSASCTHCLLHTLTRPAATTFTLCLQCMLATYITGFQKKEIWTNESYLTQMVVAETPVRPYFGVNVGLTNKYGHVTLPNKPGTGKKKLHPLVPTTTTLAAAHDAAGQNPPRCWSVRPGRQRVRPCAAAGPTYVSLVASAPCSDPALDRARGARNMRCTPPVAEPPAYVGLRNPSSPSTSASAESNSMAAAAGNIVTTSRDSARFARAPRPSGSRPDGYNGSVGANLCTPSASRRGLSDGLGVLAGTALPRLLHLRGRLRAPCHAAHVAVITPPRPPNLAAAPSRPAAERGAQRRRHAGRVGYACPIAHVPKVGWLRPGGAAIPTRGHHPDTLRDNEGVCNPVLAVTCCVPDHWQRGAVAYFVDSYIGAVTAPDASYAFLSTFSQSARMRMPPCGQGKRLSRPKADTEVLDGGKRALVIVTDNLKSPLTSAHHSCMHFTVQVSENPKSGNMYRYVAYQHIYTYQHFGEQICVKD
ncbi:hypothetical protein GGX14DRAFT_409116 [Mycena pura]|uniref:Uncharacterized protein n=1 Tax=Mycena pura TaxID=153505 RepID=A0AAD6UNY0_9AGAR|nr:hypothetical protein GGX14DRAFT_409116 [Mycena pura]